MISAREVGVYGALCALATFDRTRLSKEVINNVTFKQFLELEPSLLHALREYNAGQYESCLNVLEAAKPNLRLDMHLARHLNKLYDLVRKRGMVAFFTPYSCVDMTRMARAFNTTSEKLEEEVLQLIIEKKISVRTFLGCK